MPIIISFEFTLNTAAETFCDWLKGQSAVWQEVSCFSEDRARFAEIQKPECVKQHTRTVCSFAAVMSDVQQREVDCRKGAFSIVVSAAPRPSKIQIRAMCMLRDATDCFGYVMYQIAKAYPEADGPIRQQQREQMIADWDSPIIDTSLNNKAGRQSDPEYDKAYQYIQAGINLEAAFDKYAFDKKLTEPTKADSYNFRRAMKYRMKSNSDN